MVKVDWTTYGEQVGVARRRRKLTQQGLAERVGVSRNMISLIERGVTVPSYAIVMSICAAIDANEPPYTSDMTNAQAEA